MLAALLTTTPLVGWGTGPAVVAATGTPPPGSAVLAPAPDIQPEYVGVEDRSNPAETDSEAAARAAAFSFAFESDVPTSARGALIRAGENWGRLMSSSRPIVVSVAWVPVDPEDPNKLASAGAPWKWDAADNLYYPMPLYNARNPATDGNGSAAEITMTVHARSDYYYGLDGAVPWNQVDFVTLAMHELGHGLGFNGLAYYNPQNGTAWFYDPPAKYDTFTEDSVGTPLLSYPDNSTSLGTALRSGVYFDGARTRSGNSGSRAKLYSPGVWDDGSSYTHLDETYSGRHALMTPQMSAGEAVHDPGPIALGMLYDLGWSPASGFYGTRGTHFADVDGDGDADAIAVNDAGITVRGSNGSAFGPNLRFTPNAFYGSRATAFADVNGDKKADAIAVNDTVIGVRLSTGSTYGSTSSHWHSGTAWYGSRGTYFADVNGDGMADAIAVNDTNIGVKLSTGSSFGPNMLFATNGYYGTRGTYFADVDGDKDADAIVVNDGGVTVRLSNGVVFGSNQAWTTNAYYGSVRTAFADVTGDGKADAIAVNSGGVTVRRATFNGLSGSFSGNESWTSNAYYGSRETKFADVTGDAKADAIVVNDFEVVVRRANTASTAFDAKEYWTG